MSPTQRNPWLVRALFDTQYQFWGIQVVGWFGFSVLTYFSLTLVFGQTGWPYLLHPLVQSVIGIFVSWPMRWIFQWSWHKAVMVRIGIIIATVLSLSFVWTVLRLATFVWMTGETKNFLPEFGPWYFPGVTIFFGWAAGYHGFKYYRLLQEEHSTLLQVAEEKKAEELKRTQAEAIAQDAQLRMLRYQLNPHFLFNTLNAVMSLVSSGRNDSACRMIDQLSTFLRTSLDSDPLQPVSLRKEIETLKLYLEIEQTRFVDRLKLEFDVAPAALDIKVPSLLLQPLAENAVKHAIAPSVDGGFIRVTAAVKDEWLEVAVEDSGPGIDDLENAVPVAGGVGWRNTRDRLRTIYGDQYQIVLEHAEPSGLRVVLRVPLERQAGASEAKAAEPAYG